MLSVHLERVPAIPMARAPLLAYHLLHDEVESSPMLVKEDDCAANVQDEECMSFFFSFSSLAVACCNWKVS